MRYPPSTQNLTSNVILRIEICIDSDSLSQIEKYKLDDFKETTTIKKISQNVNYLDKEIIDHTPEMIRLEEFSAKNPTVNLRPNLCEETVFKKENISN